MDKTSHTSVIFVTDMSGSMSSKESDVIGGFNRYITDLKTEKAKDPSLGFRVTVLLFDTILEEFCTNAKLKDVPVMTTENYKLRGSTALLDAVGSTISQRLEAKPKLADDEKVILIIQTDGAENASKLFTYDEVKNLLGQAEQAGWVILFMGQGSDSWVAGHKLGVHTIQHTNSSAGTRSGYASYAGATVQTARGAKSAEVIDWMEEQPGVTEK